MKAHGWIRVLGTGAAALLLVAGSGRAQERSPDETVAPRHTDGVQEHHLDIAEKTITIDTLVATLSLELGEEEGLLIDAGATVAAYGGTLLLRGVRGTVRFRASLENVRGILDMHLRGADR